MVPEGREHTAHAGQNLGSQHQGFFYRGWRAVEVFMTAIVVPDTLDEAGQQILLDNLAQAGLSKVHLCPRRWPLRCIGATQLPRFL